MTEFNEDIRKRLIENRDLKYRDFTAKLIPNIDRETIIGVRTPVLRSLSKVILKEDFFAQYLEKPWLYYYEERNLYAYVISSLKDYKLMKECLLRLLPHVDNWANCDSISPKVLKLSENREDFYKCIEEWITSDKDYFKRFAIVMLMEFYLKDGYDRKHIDIIIENINEEYYVKMGAAWYFATALVEHEADVINILSENKLDKFTHNKTIQKAVESYRISEDLKIRLKSMRRK